MKLELVQDAADERVERALLLDPGHTRQSQDEAIKVAIQQDAAECFLQLAVFEPGRQLLAEDEAVMEALHALADGQALIEEAKQYACGAVIAVEGRADEPEPQPDGSEESGGHLMVSYQWDQQRAVIRIVEAIKQRGYTIWFDLEAMSGSTLDAMAEAIEGACCALVCMTAAYKNKLFNYASSFARRLLELNPKQDISTQARKVIQLCDANPSDAFPIEYDERNPFVICPISFVPIYRGTTSVACPCCGAKFVNEQADKTCPVCLLGKVGAEASGLVVSPSQR